MGFKNWIRKQFDPTHSANNPYTGVDANNYNLPGFQQRDQFANQQAQGALGRDAFTAQDSSFRNDQQQAMSQYRDMYANDDASLAMRQAQRDQGAAVAQQRSLMATASPANQAMMARVGSQNIGRASQAIAGNAIMGRVAERQGLANTMANLSGMARSQDQNMSQFNAGQQQQNRQHNDATAQGWAGLGLQNAGMQQSGTMNYEAQRGSRFGQVAAQPTAGERVASGIGAAVPIISGLFSDERVKKNKAPAPKEADSFMDSIEAMQYEYDTAANEKRAKSEQAFTAKTGMQAPPRPARQPILDYAPVARERAEAAEQERATMAERPFGPPAPATLQGPQPGPQLGIMAQDAEKSKMGKGIVGQTQDGIKTVQNVTGPILASLARLNERLKGVEGKGSAPGTLKPPAGSPMARARMKPGELAK